MHIIVDEYEHPSLALPFGVSLVIHALMMIMFLVVPAHLPREQPQTVIEVWPTTADEIAVATEPKGAMRIADIDEPAVQKRPAKADFVGMYDSSVDEQTVSRSGGRGAGGAPAGGGAVAAKAPKAARAKGAARRAPAKGALDFDKDIVAMREPSADTATAMKEGATSRQGAGTVSIGSGGGDYFPDIKVGEHTYLNVLRYPDISYFVRLKRVFRMTFDPGASLRDYFSANRIARGSVEVVLAVSLNGSGDLAELFVLKSSDIPGYDQEAMRTVRASAPFSKPPDKFLASDGVLRMMWTFTVYL